MSPSRRKSGMSLTSSSSLLLLSLLAISVHDVDSFASGAGGCAGGGPAVGSAHLFSNNIITGTLEDGGLTVSLDGVLLDPDVPAEVVALETHTLSLSTNSFFRGVLFRLESTNGGGTVQSSLATTDPNLFQDAFACLFEPGDVVGITHTSNVDKTSAEVSLTMVEESLFMNFGLTVVITNDDVSEYYYSGYTLHSVVSISTRLTESPTSLPTPTPIPSVTPSVFPIATIEAPTEFLGSIVPTTPKPTERLIFCSNTRSFAGKDDGCTTEFPFCAGPDGLNIEVEQVGVACFLCENNRNRITNARGCPEESPICGTLLGTVVKSHHNECYVCVNNRFDDDGIFDVGCDAATPNCRSADGSPIVPGAGGMGCFSDSGAAFPPTSEPSSVSAGPSEGPSGLPSDFPSMAASDTPSTMISNAPSAFLSAVVSTPGVAVLDVDFEPPSRKGGFEFVSDMFVDGDDEYTRGFYHDKKGKYSLTSNATGGLVVWLGGVDSMTGFNMSAGFRKTFETSIPLKDVTVQFDYQIIYAFRYSDGDDFFLLCGIDGDMIFEVAHYDVSSPRGRSNWTTAVVDVGDLDEGSHYLDLGGTNIRKHQKQEKTYVYLDNVLVTGQVA